MSVASSTAPLDVHRLEGWSRAEAAAWNSFLAALPQSDDWALWLAEAAAEMLSRPAGSRPTLTVTKVVDSDEAPVEHVLSSERTVLGREAGCDIVLPEKVITKQHAAITFDGERYLLEDLGSAMGVFRRHKQLTPHEPVQLSEDDEFSIFPYSFRFRLEALWSAESDVALGPVDWAVGVWKDFEPGAGPARMTFPLRLDPAGKRAYVQADLGLVRDLVGGMLPGLGAGADDGAGRLEVDRALLEVWLLALADRLGERLDGEFLVGLAGQTEQDAAWPLMRGVRVSTSLVIRGRARGLRLFLPFDTLEKLSYAANASSRADERISWRCRLAAASEKYAAGDLAELEPGDVLLPAERLELRLPGGVTWRCAEADEPAGAVRLEEKVVTERDVSEQDPAVESMDDLPVELEVVVAHKRLTLAEIRAMGEGSVVELDRAPDAPVELWANGVRAGRGELVEIDSKLGVKVTEWLRR